MISARILHVDDKGARVDALGPLMFVAVPHAGEIIRFHGDGPDADYYKVIRVEHYAVAPPSGPLSTAQPSIWLICTLTPRSDD